MRSPMQLRTFLLDRLDDFDVVSFDIFDTLVERRIHPPDLVKQASAASLSRVLHVAGIRCAPEEVLMIRNAVEARLRQQAVEAGGDAECELVPLVDGLVAKCAGTALFREVQQGIARDAVAQELELERQVLAPHPEMSCLFHELLRRGKRVILSSDMYLSSQQIRDLLCDNGLAVQDVPIYASGELKLCKGSGRLFRYWLERESVSPARAVHIGDNVESDGASAAAVGLHVIHFADPGSHRRRKTLDSLHRAAARNDYWKGGYVLAVCDQLKRRPPQDDFFYRYGRQFLGPVFAVFVHRLVEKVQEYAIDRLLFLAREGFILKRIYDLFEKSLFVQATPPTAAYAYISRHSTALASAQRLTPREIEIGAFKLRRGGLADVLRTYGLPEEPFASIAAEYGIPMSEPLYRADEPRLTKFLTDDRVQAAVAPFQRAAAAKLDTYLRECGFWGRNRKVALVDVGWEGTIQFNLINAFGQRQDFPQLFGFYLGRRCGRNLLYYSPSYAEGLLYDYRNYSMRERLPLEFLQIFEHGARAPHGTTLGYEWKEGYDRVQPVIKQPGHTDRDDEISVNPCLAAVQQGILDFAGRYLEAIQWTGYTSEQVKPFVLATAARFVCLPRREEAQRILQTLKHSEDFGASTSLDLGIRGFRLFHPSHWKALNYSFWRQGTLAQVHRGVAWLFTASKLYSSCNW